MMKWRETIRNKDKFDELPVVNEFQVWFDSKIVLVQWIGIKQTTTEIQ